MYTQVECAFVDKMAPSWTNMGELAPQMSVIPIIPCIQSVEVEYVEEYIIVEQINSRVRYVVSSLGCWLWQCYLNCERT